MIIIEIDRAPDHEIEYIHMVVLHPLQSLYIFTTSERVGVEDFSSLRKFVYKGGRANIVAQVLHFPK